MQIINEEEGGNQGSFLPHSLGATGPTDRYLPRRISTRRIVAVRHPDATYTTYLLFITLPLVCCYRCCYCYPQLVAV